MNSIEMKLDGLDQLAQSVTHLEDGFSRALDGFGQSLNELVSGPGETAASELQDQFTRASDAIAKAFAQAARTGELDFRSMAEAVLTDLARLSAEALIARTNIGQASQTVNLNMALGPGSDAHSVIGAAGSIATALASAAARGGRFL